MSDLTKIAGVEFYDTTRKICITSGANANLFQWTDKEYRYDQLESYEYVENQKTVAKGGGIGRAIVGGALFGSTGAIVGATTGKRSMDTIVKDVAVRMTFRVNGVLKTEKVIINQSSEAKYGSMKYERYLNTARQLIDKLDQITQQMNQQTLAKTIANNTPALNLIAHTVQPAIDVKARLIELKDLFEQGLIDEDEYKGEKKALLDASKSSSQTNVASLPHNSETQVPSETYQSFAMPVDEVFGITGQGTVVVGVIERGSVELNGQVLILRQDGAKIPALVSGIEVSKQPADYASVSDNAALMLANIDRTEVSKGDSIIIESVGSSEDNVIVERESDNLIAEYIRSHYDLASMAQAIKHYRESTGSGLNEAKEAVEKILKPSPATLDVETSIQKPRHKNYFDGIDHSGRVFYREKERETFNFAMNAIECAQEDAWNHMPESTQNQFEYVTEAVQSEIIKRINDFMAAKSFAIATKGENKKLFETAVTKLSSYMDADDLIMVVDKAVFKHNFQSGFAIGYKRVYLARDTKNNKIYTVDFQDIEKLKPDPVTDQWIINDDPNLILNYETLPNMTLAIALIIVRSYVVHGEEYILKLE